MIDSISSHVQNQMMQMMGLVQTQVSQQLNQQFTTMWTKSLKEFEDKLAKQQIHGVNSASAADPFAANASALMRENEANLKRIEELQKKQAEMLSQS